MCLSFSHTHVLQHTHSTTNTTNNKKQHNQHDLKTRYRRWTLNPDDELDIVVRCEIDGVINNKGEDQLLSIKVGWSVSQFV